VRKKDRRGGNARAAAKAGKNPPFAFFFSSGKPPQK
jgi:hypothetical protein